MPRFTDILNRAQWLSLGFICLSVGVSSCASRPASSSDRTVVEGIYRHDAVTYLKLSHGGFTEQYVTTEYTPKIVAEQTKGYGRPQATLCRATGSYTVHGDAIILTYQSDQCGLKTGTRKGLLDRSRRSLSMAGTTYVLEAGVE